MSSLINEKTIIYLLLIISVLMALLGIGNDEQVNYIAIYLLGYITKNNIEKEEKKNV